MVTVTMVDAGLCAAGLIINISRSSVVRCGSLGFISSSLDCIVWPAPAAATPLCDLRNWLRSLHEDANEPQLYSIAAEVVYWTIESATNPLPACVLWTRADLPRHALGPPYYSGATFSLALFVVSYRTLRTIWYDEKAVRLLHGDITGSERRKRTPRWT